MTDTPIQHVADTAFWVATYRAVESERPDALFRDPLAARLVEGRGRAIAGKMKRGAMTGFVVVMRTCIIDDFLRAAIDGGCDAIVNLGAGLDTRPYRMDLPPSLAWIEVDFADTIAFKEERLAGEVARCRLERVALDLGDRAARRALFEGLNARFAKVLVLTEGVVPYLANDEVASLAADLKSQPHFALWVVEYYSNTLAKLGRLRGRQMVNAPFRFAPSDWHAFFRDGGWSPKEFRYIADEARRTKRRPPMGPIRLLASLLPASLRARIRKGYGYALLERAGV